jgi:large subunit ribosomal protein L24
VQDTSRASEAAGGIIEKEGPIDVSNVMILDPTDNKPTRIGVRRTEDGRRQRYSKRTGEALD